MKAASPAKEPAQASGVKPTPTPKSPPPTGISSPSSPMTGGEKSPGAGSKAESKDKERSRTRSPLARRPQGSKQRKKFAKGQYGDLRVKFADLIDNRGQEDKQRKGKGHQKGKGKGKHKSKGKKGKQKGKAKDPGGKGRGASPATSRSGGEKSD